MFKVPEQHRLTQGPLSSDFTNGNNGAFIIKLKDTNTVAFAIASEGFGWEHVSVTVNSRRCPTWEEMCIIKDLFWSKEDCVVQFHPPESHYVNNHEFCLHLWRKIGYEFPVPEPILVGYK
jgi:hypothetical protein